MDDRGEVDSHDGELSDELALHGRARQAQDYGDRRGLGALAQPVASAEHGVPRALVAVCARVVIDEAPDAKARLGSVRVLDPEHHLLTEAAGPVDHEVNHRGLRRRQRSTMRIAWLQTGASVKGCAQPSS